VILVPTERTRNGFDCSCLFAACMKVPLSHARAHRRSRSVESTGSHTGTWRYRAATRCGVTCHPYSGAKHRPFLNLTVREREFSEGGLQLRQFGHALEQAIQLAPLFGSELDQYTLGVLAKIERGGALMLTLTRRD
jgi:hypothetical protein